MTAWNEIAAGGIDWLAESSWQAAVLAGLVALTQWAFRRNLAARWRYLLWMLVLGRLLLPTLPESPASVYRYVPSSPIQALPESALPSTAPAPQAASPRLPEVSPSPASAPSALSLPPSRRFLPWKTAAFLVWAIGAAALGAVFVARIVFFFRRLESEDRKFSATADILAEETAQEMGLRRMPSIRETSLVDSPAVVGLFRPLLLLPGGIEDRLSADELRMVLRHEMAHLKRGDLWVHFAASLLQIVHWFNPVLWWAFARMRHDRELATDALALALSGAPAAPYGETLLKLAAIPSASRALVPSVGILERHRNLKQRLEQVARLRPAAYAWSLLGVALLAGLAAVSLTKAPLLHRHRLVLSENLDLQDIYAKALQRAIQQGDRERAADLLDAGLNPNRDRMGARAPLPLAIKRGDLEMIRLLLAHGAQPSKEAVEAALKSGDKRRMDLLVRGGKSYDPVLEAVALGDVASLDRQHAAKAIPRAKLIEALPYAAAADRPASLTWLWDKSSPWTEAERHSLGRNLLTEAARAGRLDILRDLKKRGVDFATDADRALSLAVWEGQASAVSSLLDNGASFTPKIRALLLTDAAVRGNVGIARLLIAHGADAAKADENGETPLSHAVSHYAAAADLRDVPEEKTVEFVRLLLDHGANAAAKNSNGVSPAWVAATDCEPKVLALLLQHGASVAGTDSQGATILYRISRIIPPSSPFSRRVYNAAELADYDRRAAETVRLLVRAGADLNAPGPDGLSPLLTAAQLNQDALALALIEAGADLQARDSEGNTALGLAITHAFDTPIRVRLIEALLDKGLDPNQPFHRMKGWEAARPSGVPPSLVKEIGGLATFYSPAASDSVAAARQAIAILIRRGARVASPGSAPQAEAWLRAAALGDLPGLQRLAKEGTPVATADADNWTALIFSLGLGYDDMTTWLVHHGASLTAVTAEGYSPLSGTIAREDGELAGRILSAGADVTRSPYGDSLADLAYTHRAHGMMRALIEAGAKPGIDAVFRCIQFGDAATARFLIDHGAQVDPDNNEEHRGNVYWAVCYHQPEILKMLLDRGADPERKTQYNETPLSVARQQCSDLVPLLQRAIAKKHSEAASASEGPAPSPSPSPTKTANR